MCAAERQIMPQRPRCASSSSVLCSTSVLHAASTFLARHFFCLWLAVLLVRGA